MIRTVIDRHTVLDTQALTIHEAVSARISSVRAVNRLREIDEVPAEQVNAQTEMIAKSAMGCVKTHMSLTPVRAMSRMIREDRALCQTLMWMDLERESGCRLM